MSDIDPKAPFLTMCPGCAGNMYAHTDTHGKCDECGQLVTYERLVEANEAFLEAQRMLKDMMDNAPPLEDLCYKHAPFLKLVTKEEAQNASKCESTEEN